MYSCSYNSPLGTITLTADDIGLTGLWFERQKPPAIPVPPAPISPAAQVILTSAQHWLDIYFSGQEPTDKLPLHPQGTDFQQSVWQILCSIPYGGTMTYGEIATQIARRRHIPRMSAQAVGGAVGRNPISIIVPCHRVIGTGGRLTGYAGGLELKSALLELEGIMTHYHPT